MPLSPHYVSLLQSFSRGHRRPGRGRRPKDEAERALILLGVDAGHISECVGPGVFPGLYELTPGGLAIVKDLDVRRSRESARSAERRRLVELMLTGAACEKFVRPISSVIEDAHRLADALMAYREREVDLAPDAVAP